MNIPGKCPACDGNMTITELSCPDCKTSVRGSFALPDFSLLTTEDGQLLRTFLAARGKIKEMERVLDLSYPTVKSRLERLLSKLDLGGAPEEGRKRQLEIIEKLRRGEISEQTAKQQMKALITTWRKDDHEEHRNTGE